MFVITLLARTGVNVQSDLLAILVYRTHLVHFVLVRNRVISKRQKNSFTIRGTRKQDFKPLLRNSAVIQDSSVLWCPKCV